MLCFNISNIAITTIKGIDHWCIIHGIKNLKQFICLKILCLKIVGIYIKRHINEINIKNQVWNCYFNNSIKVKKWEFKNILINEKNHKDLVIHFTRYVRNKSIKTLRMQFGESIGKIEEHGGKNVWWLIITH